MRVIKTATELACEELEDRAVRMRASYDMADFQSISERLRVEALESEARTARTHITQERLRAALERAQAPKKKH
jgi:hypothetical protein